MSDAGADLSFPIGHGAVSSVRVGDTLVAVGRYFQVASLPSHGTDQVAGMRLRNVSEFHRQADCRGKASRPLMVIRPLADLLKVTMRISRVLVNSCV